MSPGQAAVLPAAVDMRQDRGVTPYLWSDLLARRNALALHRDDLVELLQVGWDKYWQREAGSREVGASLVEELLAMEEFVTEQTVEILASAPAVAGPVRVDALVDQDAFNQAYPEERTLRDGVTYPVLLHDVAAGRATAELNRRGYDVEVYRGDRRADLTVRRVACGLTKNEAGPLLGVKENKYYRWESGKAAPPAGLVAELQAVDDFITTSAAQLKVTKNGDTSIVHMLDDPDQFEQDYPNARTLRDGRPYPLRVHRVAAGRRASGIQAAGEEARIVVSYPEPGRAARP